jgi:hypothetical protein
MNSVLAAEPAILVHFQSVRVVLLVFHCVVVALLALCAGECNFDSHNGTSRCSEIYGVRHAIPYLEICHNWYRPRTASLAGLRLRSTYYNITL